MSSTTLTAKLVGDAQSLVEAFDKGEKAAGGFGGAMGKVADAGKPAFTALAAMATQAVLHFAQFGSEIHDMALRTGLGAESLSTLKFAAEQSGASLEGLETGIRKMQIAITNASQGNDILVQNFARLGLKVSELQGLKADEQFDRITTAIANIQDPTQRAAAAVDFFGKTGTQLLPMLEGGSQGLATMKQRARELGLVMSDETAAKADKLGDALDEVKGVMNRMSLDIGSFLAPAVTLVAKIIAEIPDSLIALAAAFVIAGTAAKVMGATTRSALISSGIGAAIVAIVIGLRLLADNWDDVSQFVRDRLAQLGEVWAAIWEHMKDPVMAIADVAKKVMDFVVEKIEGAINKIIDGVNKVGSLPLIGGMFGGGNVGHIDLGNIAGGVLDIAGQAASFAGDKIGQFAKFVHGSGEAAAAATPPNIDYNNNLEKTAAGADAAAKAAAAAAKALEDLARKQQHFFDTITGIQDKFQADQVQAYLEGGQQKLDAVKAEQAAMMVEARARAVDLQRLWGMDFATALKTSIDYLSAGAKNLAESSKLAAEGVSRVFGGFGNASNMESIADNAGRVFAFFGEQGQAGSGSGFFAPGSLPAGSNGLFTAGANGLPQFADGGFVPGPRGAPRLIVAHGGEYVDRNGRGGGVTVVVNVAGSLVAQSDMERTIVAAVASAAGRGAFRGTPLGAD